MLEKNSVRPLSPHLQVYKPQITSVLSITHRLTGIGLSVGVFFLLYWLASIASGSEAYHQAVAFFKSCWGQIGLGLCLWGFYYHLANGIRHLMWDMGYGFSLKVVHLSGWSVIIFSLSMTFLTWVGAQ